MVWGAVACTGLIVGAVATGIVSAIGDYCYHDAQRLRPWQCVAVVALMCVAVAGFASALVGLLAAMWTAVL